MKTLIINGREVSFSDEKNLLEVIRKAGIELPTFCYHSELSTYGACRMCLVENEKKELLAACSTPPKEGMKIKTHTSKLQKQRKITLELLLAGHDRECTSCHKNDDCKLRKLAANMGIDDIRFSGNQKKEPIDDSSLSITRDPNKCILCGDCVRMCQEVQGIGVIGFTYRGSEAKVSPAFNKKLSEVNCVDCGQCSAVCPTGAISIKSNVEEAWTAINDDKKYVVAQIAPAVRVAFGETFGLKDGKACENLIVSALKTLGVESVFDTCFSADLTAMEEAGELKNKIEKGKKLPLFTSCCPAWVKFVESKYPEFTKNLSTCKSPQQMFGSFIKDYYAKKIDVQRNQVVVLSIMPCTAKKAESKREEFKNKGYYDVDIVLTTQELIKMVKEAGIMFENLKEEPFDMPFGFATGGGVLFGATGGVAEAALRVINEETKEFHSIRGMEGVKEAAYCYNGSSLKVAVVSGLHNASVLMDKIKSGKTHYDFVEVMACPGGCIGGAGQPIQKNTGIRQKRAEGLYNIDNKTQLCRANENPMLMKLYDEWLGGVGTKKAHQQLHTRYKKRKRIHTSIALNNGNGKTHIKICIGTSCYLKGSYELYKEMDQLIKEKGMEEFVSLEATFCLEQCTEGPAVEINGELIKNATKNSVAKYLEALWE